MMRSSARPPFELIALLGLSSEDMLSCARRAAATARTLEVNRKRRKWTGGKAPRAIISQITWWKLLLEKEEATDGNHLPVPVRFARYVKALCWPAAGKRYGGNLGAAIGCHLYGYRSDFVRDHLLPGIAFDREASAGIPAESNSVAAQFSTARNAILRAAKARFGLNELQSGRELSLEGEPRPDLYPWLVSLLRLLTPETSHVWKFGPPPLLAVEPVAGWEALWFPQHQLICPDCFTAWIATGLPKQRRPQEMLFMPYFPPQTSGLPTPPPGAGGPPAEAFAAHTTQAKAAVAGLASAFQKVERQLDRELRLLRRTTLPPDVQVQAGATVLPRGPAKTVSISAAHAPETLLLAAGNQLLASVPFPVVALEGEPMEFDYRFRNATLTIAGRLEGETLELSSEIHPHPAWRALVLGGTAWLPPLAPSRAIVFTLLLLCLAGAWVVSPRLSGPRHVGVDANPTQTLGSSENELVIPASLANLATVVVDFRLPPSEPLSQSPLSWEISDRGATVRNGACGVGSGSVCSIPFSPLDRWRHPSVQVSVLVPGGAQYSRFIRFE